ncbi:YqhR family membrane protein [Paenibacillus sanguinis]|uniref:YqhR family membrane protein n=1 Tax=Paenibacillus sanguinis TaxID=225906 RepID=UPI00037BB881|nr:YqhR family membrane protein [Paenibacillus sanguinis]
MKQQKQAAKERTQPWRQQRRKNTNIWLFSLEIGCFAGLIWGGVKALFFYMGFTEVVPGYLVEPFFKNAFLHTQAGYYVGWASFIGLSLLATTIYTLALRKLRGPIPGLIYGVVWWVLLFVLLGPWLNMVPPFEKLPVMTIISEFCLYLLWGLFIGYTAAEEYTDERAREPKKTTKHALQ